MSYDKMTTAAQRVALVTEGYRKTVTVDKYEMRDAAWNMDDIARSCFNDCDPARGILAFTKMARLTPADIVVWLTRLPGGVDAIADFAENGLDMAPVVRRAA